jgi:ribosome-binding factor A
MWRGSGMAPRSPDFSHTLIYFSFWGYMKLQVHAENINNINVAHRQHQSEEVCKSINTDILRKIQFHLQTCFEIGGGHTEIYHKIGIKIK